MRAGKARITDVNPAGDEGRKRKYLWISNSDRAANGLLGQMRGKNTSDWAANGPLGGHKWVTGALFIRPRRSVILAVRSAQPPPPLSS
ncbi:hypothetical protein AMQ84_23295 [Paenibacillus riograndensis]|uniref:Uncharacterized protein n=1 Tax=Paenibacillus riograndensis TaxID=483937 RepID=A0A132TQ11_9BACL|nr:hypothetical protein [Paenibacillus riograndensis]KWX73415.1 hypothetical protein AMQ84_23295 [Paenibacillus riograndensis]